jgi:2-amino-4-hydroxy-6-hydroxymethyldihydropteridine diphosphokinase
VTETPNPHIVDADTLTGEMRPIRRAVMSLGSNLGERLTSLQGAINALADTPDVWVTGVSPVYETEPVDAPEGSETFLNAVVLLDTTLAASRLLDRAHAIEDAFGRDRSAGEYHAPRTLDVDVIVVGDRRRNDAVMQLRSCCSRGSTSSRTPRSPTRGSWPSCWRRATVAGSPGATTSRCRCSEPARVTLW